MDDAKKQLIDRLQKANNILVTVSHDPSVDQLASCIGLTLLLNKQGKHAAAVFSGKVPSTIEFLKPGDTLEKNTDSLRDFIISLDKAKADKLRYKVEEDVVRIFITPYKTSLSADDLQFSEGDFNVDVVVALGVKKQEDLDQAITAHGRILHDATVASINASGEEGLGSINWRDKHASSLSELVTDLAKALDKGGELIDQQIATALLTGIVSETGRFSNDRTSSQTMSASATLLSAGANQQLVASKLEEGSSEPEASGDTSGQGQDRASETDKGELDIDHSAAPPPTPQPSSEPPKEPPKELPETQEPPEPEAPTPNLTPGPKMITEPPSMGGTLTASSQDERLDPATDPLSMPRSESPALLNRKGNKHAQTEKSAHKPKAKPKAPVPPPPPAPSPPPPPAPPPPASQPPAGKPDETTLAQIEKSVASPHSATLSELEAARGEVNKALVNSEPDKPIKALNAQPLGDELHGSQAAQAVQSDAKPPVPPADDSTADDTSADSSGGSDSPPPVPPPIPFQFGNNSPPPQQ